MYKVITIDDEPMIKKTLRKLIDETGRFQVVAEAEDGREALGLIESHSPDLIISDIRMPVMDGLELLEELHKRSLKPEVVIISGYDDFAYAQRAIRYGVAEYLLKPIRPALLQETLDRLSARFERERRSVSDRGRWIMLCKKQAESIAEKMWMLDEQAAVDEIKRFDEALHSESADDPQIRTAYFELLWLIHGSLTEKGGRLFEDGNADPVPDHAESLFDHAASLIAAAMASIRQTRNWGSHQGIQRAVEYVKRNYSSETLSMQEVAEHVHMSPAYFSRSFKEEMGVAFVQFLTQLRMEKAKKMLEDPECKTADIAAAIGYADYPHFTKVFKKYCGVTPTEYRKRLGVL